MEPIFTEADFVPDDTDWGDRWEFVVKGHFEGYISVDTNGYYTVMVESISYWIGRTEEFWSNALTLDEAVEVLNDFANSIHAEREDFNLIKIQRQ